ncbi:MAG: hypothetical protein RBU37_08520 [Myxococcota bacterium]|jgi:hypothetical protein|nr:hypothetical protein [Myxococcota bacterium]
MAHFGRLKSTVLFVFLVILGVSCDDEDTGVELSEQTQTDAPDGADDDSADEEGELSVVVCSGLEEAACGQRAGCYWLVASCPDEFIAAACFQEGERPQPPPCAPQPCREYLDEASCAAEFACNWWPSECLPEGVVESCRNIGLGSPSCAP